MQKLSFLKPAIPLTVISIVIALLLSLVNMVTANKIAENAIEKKNDAISSIFTDFSYSKTYEDTDGFEKTVSEVGKVFNAKDEIIGYYAEVSPVGFKGEISIIVGMDADGKILNASLLSASETPGLGTKATDAANLGKYSGKTSAEAQKVDTITGATISSKAVREGISNGAKTVEHLIKEGK